MNATQSLVRAACIALTLLGVAPAIAQDAPTDDAPAVTWDGSFLTRYEARRNYGHASDVVVGRARLGLDIAPIDIGPRRTLGVRFVPQAAGAWHAGGDTLEDAELGLHEGYVRLELDRIGLDAGRMELAYGDHLVIGNVGWHPVGRSFDALRLRLGEDAAVRVDVFGSVVREGVIDGTATDDIGAGDVWFTGVYAMFGPAIADDMALDLYALTRVQPDDGTVPTTAELTLGARAKGATGRLDYRAEVGAQLGRHPESPRQTATAWQGDGEVGVSLGADGDTARIGLTGFAASGDDPETDDVDEGWQQLYPTAHKWLGYMDAVGPRSNIGGGGLLLSARVADPVTAYVDAYSFHRLEDSAAQPAGSIGTEIDIGARYALGTATGARVGYGVLLPSDDFAADTLHFVELELRTELP